MNIRISSRKTSAAVLARLHQCRQCGIIFERKGKAVFSWDRRFMVDRCDICSGFRRYY